MSTTSTTTQLMTADEFWEYVHRSENEHRNLDLIQGVVVEMSRATRFHGYVTGNIGRLLGNWTFTTGVGYIATNDAGVVLEDNPDSVLGPDVAYYTDANSADDVPPKWGDVAPVLAVEVLSPNDRMSKVNAKIATYLRSGVRLVWLVDFEERVVTVYRPQQDLVVLKADSHLASDNILPGFSCKVSDFFQLPGDIKPVTPST